jgi:hypothetical protein
MTLLIGSAVGLICGAVLGVRRRTALIVGFVWYVCLAVQTAHLAHPGVRGFFGVEALPAVQGRNFAQYWVSQPVILAFIAAMTWLGDRLGRAIRRSRLAKGAHSASESATR